MVFKAKKIPKHLIIQEEYELRKRSRFGLVRFLLLSVAVISLTWIVSIGLVQI
jgi:hypothetical protein